MRAGIPIARAKDDNKIDFDTQKPFCRLKVTLALKLALILVYMLACYI